jgi:tRNA-modifying protein YgfZ
MPGALAPPLHPVDTTLLREGALSFDLTGRGSLTLTGPDRAAFLQGVVSNDVKKLRPGTGCPALFLTAKGKLRATLDVLALDDSLLIDTEPALAAELADGLRRYIVYPPVGLEDATDATGVVHVEGPLAPERLASNVGPLPSDDRSHLPFSVGGVSGRIVAVSRGGERGFDLRLPRPQVPLLLAALAGLGIPLAGPEVLDVARIESGIPRWGAELDASVLPDEAGLQRTAVSYTKGCYVGQETVARLKTYGHVNRQLRRLLLPAGSAPAAGDEVLSPGADGVSSPAGRLASAVASIRLGRVAAFAWLRREAAADGQPLAVVTSAGTVPADLVPLGQA